MLVMVLSWSRIRVAAVLHAYASEPGPVGPRRGFVSGTTR